MAIYSGWIPINSMVDLSIVMHSKRLPEGINMVKVMFE